MNTPSKLTTASLDVCVHAVASNADSLHARNAGPDYSGPGPRSCYECFQATLKLVPPLSAEVCAFRVDPETMSILSGLNVPIGWPLTVTELKLAVPKFVSGSTPPELEGASAIASADASLARLRRWDVVKLWPVVVFVIVNVKRPPPSVVTDPLIESPALIGSERLTGNFGYISYQA